MTWVRLDDGFSEHPKVHDLSDRAFRLHVASLCYCGRNLTDGLIGVKALRMLLGSCAATKRHVGELVTAGLWETEDGGHRIHDFLELNPTAASVKRERDLARERQRKHREARNAVTDGVSNAVSHGSPVPVPSLPVNYLKAVTADQEIEYEVDGILKCVSDADEGSKGVLVSIARKLPLSSVAKVRESCLTRRRKVGVGYAVAALRSELATIDERNEVTA